MPTVGELLQQGRGSLTNSSTPALDSELLLAHELAVSRSQLLARSDQMVPASAEKSFRKSLAQRQTGYPLAYMRERQEFYGRDFLVNEDVLIPRPDTETLVEAALSAYQPGDVIIEIGSGCGCVAITLALESGGLVHGLDISPVALTVARQNADQLGAVVSWYQGDLWLDEWWKLDPTRLVVVANLPYVSDSVYTDSPNLRHEPASALRAGTDGLEVISRLLKTFGDREYYPRALLLELDPAQAEVVTALAWGLVNLWDDLRGRPRVAQLSSPSARRA